MGANWLVSGPPALSLHNAFCIVSFYQKNDYVYTGISSEKVKQKSDSFKKQTTNGKNR